MMNIPINGIFKQVGDMRRRMKSIKIILTVLFISLTLTSFCPSTDAADLEKVTIQLKLKHQFQFAGYYAAKAKGFYAEEGLDVQLKAREKGEGHIRAVVEGRAEYGVADAGLVVARMNGTPVVLLAQIFQHSPLVYISKRESGILGPHDMIGKRVMQDRGDAPLDAMLIETLGDLDKVTLVQHSFRNDEFIEGAVDVMSAYITNEPFTLKQRGIEVTIINPRNYGIDFYGDNLFTTEQEIRRYPGRADRVRQATLKGWDYALKHPDEIIDLILEKYPTQLTRERLASEARATAVLILPELVRIGDVDPVRYRRVAETYARLGMTKSADLPHGFFYEAGSYVALTPEEKEWLKAHPRIKLGYTLQYEPALLRNPDGSLGGLFWDILELIRKRLPVDIDLEVDDLKGVLTNLERRNLDGALAVDYEAAKKLGLLTTTPFWTARLAVFAKANDTPAIRDCSDLAGRKVAVVAGNYANLVRLRETVPNADIVEVKDVLEGLQSVYFNKTYAFAGYSVQNYLTFKYELTGIMPAFVDVLQDKKSELFMGLRSDWPELIPILNKTIASITNEERDAIIQKWTTVQPKLALEEGPMGMVPVIMGVMVLTALAIWLLIRLAGDRLPVGLGTIRNQSIGIIMASLFLTVLVTSAWFGIKRIEHQTRTITGEMLNIAVRTTAAGLKAWFNSEKDHIELLVREPEVIEPARQLLRIPRTRDELLASAALRSLRDYFVNMFQIQYHRGFHIISPDLINIGSMRDENIGLRNLIAEQRPELLQRAFSGQTVFIPPIFADAPLKDAVGKEQQASPSMFVATPLRDPDGAVIAVFILHYDPIEYFTDLIKIGRIGKTGETYVFDGAGRLASKIRLMDDLIRIGLLPKTADSTLGFRLSDPGGNLLLGHRASLPREKQPLTRMVAATTAGQSGVNVAGYRDYRGIRVLGAWVWDKEMQIGLSTEIDEQEALSAYYRNRVIVLGVLVLVVLLTSALVGFLILHGERANRALRRARDEWERVAQARSAELKVSSERLELATRAANIGIWDWNIENNVLIWDDAMYAIYGSDRNDFTGAYEAWVQALHPDDSERVQQEVNEALQGAQDFSTEFRIVWPDDTVHHIQAIAAVYKDQSDRAQRMVGVNWDITEGKQAQQELQKLSQAVEQSPATVVITDTQGSIQYVNPRFTEMTGYTAAEVIGQNPRILQSGTHTTDFYKEMWATIVAGNVWHGEFCNRRKNGELYWESAAIVSVKDAQDKTTHYVAVKEDITERRQAQQEYQLILKTALDGFWILDSEGRFLDVNDAYCHLIGYTRDELLKMRIPDIEAKEGPEETARHIRKIIEQGYDRFETRHRHKNGTVIDVEISAQFTDFRGGVFVVFVRDITVHRRAQEQLRQAKELAETANRTKSDFLANMSHEIRTPMNAVLGFLELVLEDPSLTERQRKYLTTAQISASGLLRLINDILDISKLESGKLTIEQRPFSLLRLMQAIHETMDITVQEKSLELQLDVHPSVSGSFVGDPLRLRQIMINLVGNAIKFTEEGRVFMRIMPAEEEGQFHFMIEDTGIGIPADRLSQIFDPFTQADTSTTRYHGGTGLGTTIARELVELMGGRIWAESEESKGSTFHFTINLTPTDQVPEEADLFIVPGRAVLPGSRRGFRILLAEDVEANVDLAKIRLEQQGHEVTVAWNGRQAVEAFKRGGIDLILMDVQMPEMDGLEAAERIRALEADTGGHVPIIAMTASIMKEETEKYFDAGMDAIVAKPIDFGKLFKTMEDVVPEGVGEAVSEDARDVSAPSGLELPPLDGVDIKKGIQTWQNPEAYAKALLGFSRDYGNAAADLSRLIDEGDIDSAYRIVHALKGVAGNLSVTEVADAAIDIDAALREKRIDDVKGKLPVLAAALNTAVDSIRQLETVEAVEEMPKKEMDVPHLKKLFIEMLAAFDQFSPYAIEPFLSELKEYLSQDQLSPIVKHMERFDFDGAKQETVKLAKILKIDLEG